MEAVVELAEGLPPHDVGGVDGQPVVLHGLQSHCVRRCLRGRLWVGVRSCSSGQLLVRAGLRSSIMLARLVGKTFMLSTNLSGPQLVWRGLGRGGCRRPA